MHRSGLQLAPVWLYIVYTLCSCINKPGISPAVCCLLSALLLLLSSFPSPSSVEKEVSVVWLPFYGQDRLSCGAPAVYAAALRWLPRPERPGVTPVRAAAFMFVCQVLNETIELAQNAQCCYDADRMLMTTDYCLYDSKERKPLML